MGEKEGFIEVTVHYDALGGVERYGYEWIGGDVAKFSEQLLLDADPSEVRYDEFPRRPGDKFEFGPFKLRVLESDSFWRWDVITAIRDRGIVTDLRCSWHRFGKLADIAYRRLVITLAVWRLAERNEGAIPTWRDVHALRRLADWERAKREERTKKMIDKINRKPAKETDGE